MGVYRRSDSGFWYLWLETAPAGQQRVKTDVVIGTTPQTLKESRRLAELVYHARMGDLAKLRHGLPVETPEITFDAFADWYDQHVIEHHRGKLREREILKTLRSAFGPRLLSQIDRAAVLEWRSLRAAKTSASTANRELDLLKHLLGSAVPKYLAASPIAKLARLRPKRTETRVLTRVEEARLLKVLAPADRALIICALDTLMRLSDVVNLRRDQDRGSYLLVVDPKVEPYRVPVSKRLRKALDGLPKAGPYYFQHRRQAKNPRDYRGSVQDMLEAACKAAGIPYGRGSGITFHALRHTGTTRLVEAGVPLRVVQELGGWKSMRQLERYAHPTDDAKQQAVELIGVLSARSRSRRNSLKTQRSR